MFNKFTEQQEVAKWLRSNFYPREVSLSSSTAIMIEMGENYVKYKAKRWKHKFVSKNEGQACLMN